MRAIKLKLSQFIIKLFLTLKYWGEGDPWYKAREIAQRIVNGWD